MKNVLCIFICFSFFSCTQFKPLKTFKVFSEVDSLSVISTSIYNEQDFFLLPKKVLAADTKLKNKKVIGWTMENIRNTPSEILIISRTLNDFDLTFHVFDSNRNLVETKRIYWGMLANDREENSYLPIKSVFIDAHERLEIIVVIEKSFRQVIKPIFEISSSDNKTEFVFRKTIDSILTAFLIANLVFSVWLFRHNHQLKNVIGYYLLYNLFILLFFFFRYFLSYFNNFNVPVIVNYAVSIFSNLAYFSYYYFGLYFIDTNYKTTKTEKVLLAISLLSFLIPTISFHQITLTIRTIIVFIFLANLYRFVFYHRKNKQSQVFFFISLPLLILGGVNTIYGILFTDFYLKYALEFSKISIIAESVMLFGGLIVRSRTYPD